MGLRHLLQHGALAYARVRKDNVDAPFLRLDRFVEAVQIPQVRHIATNAGGVTADAVHRVVELLLPPTYNEDVGALFDEEPRGGQSYPRGAASYHRYLVLQFS